MGLKNCYPWSTETLQFVRRVLGGPETHITRVPGYPGTSRSIPWFPAPRVRGSLCVMIRISPTYRALHGYSAVRDMPNAPVWSW
eukprot:3544050-Rhodomonas_salina.2